MDQITSWLKETIPGIILLGAIGSIVAVFLLEKTRSLKEEWHPRFAIAIGRLFHWWLDEPLRESIELKLTQKSYPVLAMFAFELGKLAFLPWLAIGLGMWANREMQDTPDGQLPLAAIILVSTFFLCLYEMAKALCRLWYHRVFTMNDGVWEKTVEEFLGSRSTKESSDREPRE